MEFWGGVAPFCPFNSITIFVPVDLFILISTILLATIFFYNKYYFLFLQGMVKCSGFWGRKQYGLVPYWVYMNLVLQNGEGLCIQIFNH